VKKEEATVPGRLTLTYKDLGQKLEGRPPHTSHMEYKILVSDVIVDKVALLKEGGIDTASPIDFDRPEDRGKYLSISGRWISNGGKPGGWGPVDGFIIP
jgi:hypothetical protein